MKEYEFTLKYKLPDAEADPEAYLEQLLEAGCDDALVGIGQTGQIALQFDRQAESAVEAVRSAMRDVMNAIPAAEFTEAAPDFVGVTDIAEILGFSRQNMRKLLQTHSASFPPAVHSGKFSIWHLANVFAWFESHQSRAIEPAMAELAKVNMQLNLDRDMSNFDPEIEHLLMDKVG